MHNTEVRSISKRLQMPRGQMVYTQIPPRTRGFSAHRLRKSQEELLPNPLDLFRTADTKQFQWGRTLFLKNKNKKQTGKTCRLVCPAESRSIRFFFFTVVCTNLWQLEGVSVDWKMLPLAAFITSKSEMLRWSKKCSWPELYQDGRGGNSAWNVCRTDAHQRDSSPLN